MAKASLARLVVLSLLAMMGTIWCPERARAFGPETATTASLRSTAKPSSKPLSLSQSKKLSTNQNQESLRVLIVGASLAGLSTALSLVGKNDRIKVTIVECRPDFQSRGATFSLAPLAQKALEELAPACVLDKLKKEGLPFVGYDGYMLPWWRARDCLLEEVRKLPDKIEIHLGVSIDDVVVSDEGGEDRLVAKFKDSDLVIDADVLVGADGVNSFVRTNILKLPPACPTQAYVWRGSFDTTQKPSLKHFQDYPLASLAEFGNSMLLSYFNFHQRHEGKMAWVFAVRGNALPSNIAIESGKTTPKDLLESLLTTTKGDPELQQKYDTAMLAFENTHQKSDLTWSSEMKVVDLTTREGWGGKGRITLVGDAAHALRPVTGIGGGLAFEDAALLGHHLAECTSAKNIETQLRAFEQRRLPRCRSLSNDQTLRANLSYEHGFNNLPQWDPKYSTWMDEGFSASPDPPVSEEEVFRELLSK